MTGVFGDLQVEGRRFVINGDGALLSNEKFLTSPCVDAVVTVGAETTNVRPITIQLLDAYGQDVTERTFVKLHVMADANGDAFVGTGGSTGIAIGTDGALLAVVAKKSFIAVSEADGDISLTWTDTGDEIAYLFVELPNGRIVKSAIIQNAA
jgi:hypothetical protein